MKILSASLVVALAALGPSSAAAAEIETTLVSTRRDGSSAGSHSEIGGISGTGRFVVFTSKSPDVVRGDTNGARDVFVWDRRDGTAERVNVSSDGSQAVDGGCKCNISAVARGISDTGYAVLFTTRSASLVKGDDDSRPDGFVHDRRSGETTLITTGGGDSSTGDVADISPDTRFVLYSFQRDYDSDVALFILDRETGRRLKISKRTGSHEAFSGRPVAISDDGERATFVSNDPSLVDNQLDQVFVFDRSEASVTQVSVSSEEEGANSSSGGGDMSADGRYVLFESGADNLLPLGEDTNLTQDVFRRDLESGATTRVNVSETGMQAMGGASWSGEINESGCRAVFESQAANLVPDDSNETIDMFVRDLCANTTTRVSVASDGTQADGLSYRGVISYDGRWVAFQSQATHHSPQDGNPKYDVFVRGPFERRR